MGGIVINNTLVEALGDMMEKVYEQCGSQPIFEIVLLESQAFKFGVMPGCTVVVSTPTGEINVRSERRPR